MNTVDSSVATPHWGVKGHALVHREAVEHLPADVPDFFRASEERIVSLASQPDRWKVDGLNYLTNVNRPDHYLAYELVKDKPLPADRYAAAIAADKAGLKPTAFGTMPYRVAELYQNLTVDFAIWRNQTDRSTPAAQQAQENVIYDAGVIGHYVGDAAQPLHSTIHSNGWRSDVPNPNGYRTTPGLHREFETLLVNGSVDEAKVAAQVGPTKILTGDPLQFGLNFAQESNAQVEHLYQLDKAGAFIPGHPTSEGVAFAESRIAKGAENLRDLWYSAWLDSAAVADRISHDQPE